MESFIKLINEKETTLVKMRHMYSPDKLRIVNYKYSTLYKHVNKKKRQNLAQNNVISNNYLFIYLLSK